MKSTPQLIKRPLWAIATPTGWHTDHSGHPVTFSSSGRAEVMRKLNGVEGEVRQYEDLAALRDLPESIDFMKIRRMYNGEIDGCRHEELIGIFTCKESSHRIS